MGKILWLYKKPGECSVPFYIYVFQACYSFGSYMEAFKYINDHEQTCNVICHLLSREFGKKKRLQDSTSAYFRKLQIAGRQVGVPLQRLLIVFKL